MNLQSLTKARALSLACGLTLALGLAAGSARADGWNQKTILTVSQPIQITDRVLLEPGQYVLKLMDSQSDRHVVQIFNGDETHIINTVLAIPAYRMNVTGHTQFRFWETPPGYAKALRNWYYPGENYGQEFAYPKQLAMLETAAATQTQTTQTAQQETTPEPAPQAEVQQQQETEEAQATPPPAETPAEQTPEPTPAPEQPQSLPKTGSPYPAIGLAGMGLLALYGLLRFRLLA